MLSSTPPEKPPLFESVLPDEAATLALGEQIAAAVDGQLIVFLHGNLGAGKTTLSKGILRGLGYGGAVKSPTYTLVEQYPINGQTHYHFDLYRLVDPEELDYMGIRDYLAQPCLCLIEWPAKGEGWLPDPDLVVTLAAFGEGRKVVIAPEGERGQRFMERFFAEGK